MKRIILHWTAGAHSPSGLDLTHYHFIVDGKGQIHSGKFPVSANAGNLTSGQYAAHTLNLNTQSIGIAVAAMAGAKESPLNVGKAPITQVQLDAFVKLAAKLAKQYAIPVTRQTVLTHAEVQPTLGVKQKGKWDITWLPGYGKKPPIEAGDILRNMIQHELVGLNKQPAPAQDVAVASRPYGQWLAAFLNWLFGRKK